MITKKIFIKDLQRKIKIILLSILCLYFFSACQKNENTTVVCNGYYYNQEMVITLEAVDDQIQSQTVTLIFDFEKYGRSEEEIIKHKETQTENERPDGVTYDYSIKNGSIIETVVADFEKLDLNLIDENSSMSVTLSEDRSYVSLEETLNTYKLHGKNCEIK